MEVISAPATEEDINHKRKSLFQCLIYLQKVQWWKSLGWKQAVTKTGSMSIYGFMSNAMWIYINGALDHFKTSIWRDCYVFFWPLGMEELEWQPFKTENHWKGSNCCQGECTVGELPELLQIKRWKGQHGSNLCSCHRGRYKPQKKIPVSVSHIFTESTVVEIIGLETSSDQNRVHVNIWIHVQCHVNINKRSSGSL